jgi:uncharacterized membrane protein
MQGKATFRGHPLHLMLVSFPVAFWTGAVFTDIFGLVVADTFWLRMSVTLIAMGTATGALASILGYIDYATVRMDARARSVGTIHMWTSLATLALYAVAYALRAHAYASPAGIAVSMTGAVVLLAGGYYGSELANRHRVGIAER